MPAGLSRLKLKSIIASSDIVIGRRNADATIALLSVHWLTGIDECPAATWAKYWLNASVVRAKSDGKASATEEAGPFFFPTKGINQRRHFSWAFSTLFELLLQVSPFCSSLNSDHPVSGNCAFSSKCRIIFSTPRPLPKYGSKSPCLEDLWG